MTGVNDRARAFFNVLDLNRPINFGQTQLVEADRAQPESFYVPNLHGEDDRIDPVVELATQIDYSDSAGAYLFTGNPGTGKTSELLRLARQLKQLGSEVFYVDMSEYLNLSLRVEVTDFLISVLGALSEKVADRFATDIGKAGFFERTWAFLNSEVTFTEVSLPGPMELKGAIQRSPHFKEELQRRTRGHVQTLVKSAREFAGEVVDLVRERRADPDMKVVLIVDSVERLRGVGDSKDVQEVFKSTETLFGSHADELRFPGLDVVYTIPSYLQALTGALGSKYAGGRIYALPSVHVYGCCPEPGKRPEVSTDGVDKMMSVIERRFPGHSEFFAPGQLERLAQSSGGDLRDFFRMVRLAVIQAKSRGVPLDDTTIEHAEDAVRRDMLPIADDDRDWLKRIAASHSTQLPSLDKLPAFARLQQGKYVLQYRNGEDWYAVHPLLWEELGLE